MSSYRQVGTVLTDHVFAVPLDHDRPDGEQIEVFAREVVAADRSPGGLPGLDTTADDVYRVTYGKVRAKTRAHYARYPGDVDQARRVARHLRNNEVVLPGGAPLTIEAFQSLGRMLDSSTGGDDLHYLIEDPFAGDVLSDAFLHAVQQQLSFAAGPLYAVLHEPSYAQGCAT